MYIYKTCIISLDTRRNDVKIKNVQTKVKYYDVETDLDTSPSLKRCWDFERP